MVKTEGDSHRPAGSSEREASGLGLFVKSRAPKGRGPGWVNPMGPAPTFQPRQSRLMMMVMKSVSRARSTRGNKVLPEGKGRPRTKPRSAAGEGCLGGLAKQGHC